MWSKVPDNPYLLLTPGPLSTSKKVRAAMLRDWCTWDDDYNIDVVEDIRRRLVRYATSSPDDYTAVLMQGSGSFGVEHVWEQRCQGAGSCFLSPMEPTA